MSRLQEFKDTLGEVKDHLEMAEGYIDDALCDLADGYIGIKSDVYELKNIKNEIRMLHRKINELQKDASY